MVSLAVGKSYKRNDIPWPNEFDHTTRRCVLAIKTILVDFDRPLRVRIPILIAGVNPIGGLGNIFSPHRILMDVVYFIPGRIRADDITVISTSGLPESVRLFLLAGAHRRKLRCLIFFVKSDDPARDGLFDGL